MPEHLTFNQSRFLLLSIKSTDSDDSLSVNEPSVQRKIKETLVVIWQIITTETVETEEEEEKEIKKKRGRKSWWSEWRETEKVSADYTSVR